MDLQVFPRALLLLALALMLRVSAAGAQAAKAAPEPARDARADAAYHGGLVSPLLPKPRFTLTDTSGAPFDFRAQTEGHVTLLYFGYTHCPDMCPLEMSTIAKALKELPPEVADDFKVVFVTTDPARDTAEALRLWLGRFNKRFIGLTGSENAVVAAQIAANLPPARKSSVRPDGSYEVGHAAFVLAYTKDNLAHVIYPAGVSEQDWTHDLARLEKETWPAP